MNKHHPSDETQADPLAAVTVPFTRFTSRKLLTKSFQATPEGGIAKSPGVPFATGKAERVTIAGADPHAALQQFEGVLGKLTAYQAIGLGVEKSGAPTVDVVTKRMKGTARTLDNWQMPSGAALMLFDFDGGTGFNELATRVYPDWDNVATLTRPSVSQGVVNTATGLTLAAAGEHCYAIIDDASRALATAQALERLFWKYGYGRVLVAANGMLLRRSPIDIAVYSPERVIYEGLPRVIKPIAALKRECMLCDGGMLVAADLIAYADQFISEEEATDLFQAACQTPEVRAESAAKRAAWTERKVAEMVAKGTDATDAREKMRRFLDSAVLVDGTYYRMELPLDMPITLDDGSSVTPREILADPARWEGKTLPDPIEGRVYGASKARVTIIRDHPHRPYIRSFGHGLTVYHFEHDSDDLVAPLLAAAARLNKQSSFKAIDAVLSGIWRAGLDTAETDRVLKTLLSATGQTVSGLRKRLKALARKGRGGALPAGATRDGLTPGHYRKGGIVYRQAQPGADAPDVAVASDMRVVARKRLPEDHGWLLQVEAPRPGGRGSASFLVSEALLVSDAKKGIALIVDRLGVKVFAGPAAACRAIYPCGDDIPLGTFADRSGWFLEGGVFATPNTVIGDETGSYAVKGGDKGFTQKGTLDGWKREVAAMIAGNPAWILMASTIFAAIAIPFMPDGRESNVILHFYGETSTGKTTGARGAVSIWGPQDYMSKWRATANALEAVAQSRTHTGLALDEIKEAQPHEIASIAYMYAAGEGKTRMKADTSMQETRRWATMGISTGEKTLADHARSSAFRRDQSLDPGASARVIDLDMPMVEDIHGHATSDDFVRAFTAATVRHHGHAGPAFVRWLLAHQDEARERISAFIAEFEAMKILPADATTQARRIAGHIAATAAAGCLACEVLGLDWDVREACRSALRAWVAKNGGSVLTGTGEAVEDLISFVVAHQERFAGVARSGPPEAGADSVTARAPLAGWFVRQGTALASVAIIPSALDEAGWPRDRVERVMRHLRDKGFLMAKPDALKTSHRSGTGIHTPVYKIKAAFFEGQIPP